MKLIDISDLKFSYSKTSSEVLNVAHFKVNKGEKIFLFGPSGCGKTTFLETLAGVLIPQVGKVEIDSTVINQLSPAERDQFRAAHMGYIFQSFNLIPYLSVYENITLPLYLSPHKRRRISVDNEKAEVQFICQKLGIENYLDQAVTALSVGQQQRVAAARALMGKPQLILADEPTSSLDTDHREKFLNLLFELCQKNETALLFVSHDQSLKHLFDRVISLPEINAVKNRSVDL